MDKDDILSIDQVVERAADIAWEAVIAIHDRQDADDAEGAIERLRRYLAEVLAALGLPPADADAVK